MTKILVYAVSFLGVIVSSATAEVLPQQGSLSDLKIPQFIDIAHRGASGYVPEHSQASTVMAHAMGADYIEQDIQLTRDSVPVVLHDEVLDYITVVNISYFSTALAINLDTWNKLPSDIQAIMQEAANERGQEQLEMLEAYMAEAEGLFEKNNVNYHVASKDELAGFQTAVAPVYDWWKGQVADGDKYIEFAKKNQ